ncbi:glucuronate isomerase [Natrinema salsiterrestre]|uniref:Uronate isomerase n=1 Tax=Natrinema salsiterrestre TaxID=2950540 RepID=A0A9Q4L0Y4_9EURY|nr:glucuronate isomerase [Natrinema salsiterrestre]MDF9747848.1 glucuronate isomerase [Natrinema salsiterrestre]
MAFEVEEYLLESEAAKDLYTEIESLPIVDPHSHADLSEIVANDGWDDIWEVEGATDHYVWSMMRKRGVPERKITGDASNKEKWMALAEVFPELAGNPTYEWIQLDLRRRFGIEKPLSAETGEKIWEETKDQLSDQSMKPQALLADLDVEVLCTTDDPTSSLADHETAEDAVDGIETRPTWRVDRALKIDQSSWTEFVDELEAATGTDTSSLSGYLTALADTHDYFAEHGCRACDLSLEEIVTRPVSEERAGEIYAEALAGENLSRSEIVDFQAFLLEKIGQLNREKDWVTQLHIGAVRDYREELYETVGADAGGDVSTQSIELADNLRYFLNEFDGDMEIVLYTVDPTHYPTITTLSRAFPNVSIGPAWWFNDSPYGMDEQLRQMGSVDLLANHAGMVSDSRKLISYGSRFEMFRRVLANVLGEMVDRRQMPMDHAKQLATQLAYDRPRSLYGF